MIILEYGHDRVLLFTWCTIHLHVFEGYGHVTRADPSEIDFRCPLNLRVAVFHTRQLDSGLAGVGVGVGFLGLVGQLGGSGDRAFGGTSRHV